MCGICGYLWGTNERKIERPLFEKMTDSLSHRGPDDRGIFYALPGERRPDSPGIAFGHRRLSILDLSAAGRQPMAAQAGSFLLVFNGEIYNFPELRSSLREKGYQFHTGTDTEVIPALYQEYGEKFPAYLNGMFSIALWDHSAGKLILVRDRLGKKPLFYRSEPNRFIFASELNTLLFAPDLPRELDRIALDQYLIYQYIPAPRSIYRGIAKLPPAHTAIWQPGSELTIRPYWTPDFNIEENRSKEEWSEILRDKLENAVRIRLRSDVPLGAFLSGGIDSTIIAGLMQKLSSAPVKTYSIGFAQKEYDETPIARNTAKRLGTEHHELFITPDAESLFSVIARQYGEPFADSSAIPCRLMCELTRSEVTVALSGDGGDELFAGYDRYKAVSLGKLADHIPLCVRQFLAGPFRYLVPSSAKQRSIPRRLKRFLEGLTMSPAERYLQWIAVFNRNRIESLYSPESRHRLIEQIEEEEMQYNRLDLITDAMQRAADRDLVTQTSTADLLTYLPGDILTKMDIASMTWGLEVRSPILDYEVAELAFRIPIHLKMNNRKGKIILRDTFREFIPSEIENRPKTGFGVPLDHWFRGPLKKKTEETLTDENNQTLRLFSKEYIGNLLRRHFAGDFDHSARIWSLLILSQFQF